MMKILFNRNSPVVRSLEVFGLLLSLLYLKKHLSHADVTTGFYLFLFLCYLFVRICDWIHWYPKEPRGVGIEVHFKKSLVPTSYILSITSIFALWNIPYLSTAVVVFAVLLMLVVAPVNGIQIYFHLRDKDPLPINYFSLNKYQTSPVRPPQADRHPLLSKERDGERSEGAKGVPIANRG